MTFRGLVLTLFIATACAYTTGGKKNVNRRELLSFVAGTVALSQFSPGPANAIDSCPAKTNNCIRTTWTPPAGTKQADAVKVIKKALDGYPQEGQNGVDLGGYTVVEDSLGGSGVVRVEYKSGIGKFAKFFNGGKPFVDDLAIEVGSNGVAEIKSASRVGDSDFEVNKKRLTFLANTAKEAGWTVPDPKY